MDSQIDPLIPISGVRSWPVSESVRLNFRHARDEINQLDSSKLPLNGGAMNGPLRFILPIAPPTMGVRSPGTRIVLYDLLGLGSVDYAIGVAAGTTWFSIPGGRFDWYCNEDVIATLDASGNVPTGGMSAWAATLSTRTMPQRCAMSMPRSPGSRPPPHCH